MTTPQTARPVMPPPPGPPWLALANGINLRDVGGLPCTDGRVVRHGVLFRGGSLRLLTAEEAQTLAQDHGIDTVVDLRAARELKAEGPSRLARLGVATLHLPLIGEDAPGLPEAADEDDATTALVRAYRGYLTRRGQHLVTAARVIAAGQGAALVHCAAGKDRTGVTVAMLLDAVGVERAAILADYEATNEVIEPIMSTLATAYGYLDEVGTVDMTAHYARPRALATVLSETGGAREWFRARGLAENELGALSERLTRSET